MNHIVRATTIVGGAFPRRIRLNDGTTVDVSAWHADLVKAVAKGLKCCERDAHLAAIRSAANAIIRVEDTPSQIEATRRAFRRVLALEQLPKRRAKRGSAV